MQGFLLNCPGRLLLLLGAIAGATWSLPAQGSGDFAKMSNNLQRQMLQANADPTAQLPILILLREQVDLAAVAQVSARRSAGEAVDGHELAPQLVQTLERQAAATQPALLAWLKNLSGVDQASLTSYWITNAIGLRANRAAIQVISQHAEVAWVELELPLTTDGQAAPILAPALLPGSSEVGLSAIGAPFMWNLGYTGYGRKVLVIDSGQDYVHPTLRTQFLYNYAPQSQTYNANILGDLCESHGTHVTGTVVGLDRVNRDTIGVAFNAQWMGSPSVTRKSNGDPCSYQGGTFSILSTFQWALNPDRNINTTSDIPDVINNSYGRSSEFTTECFSTERNAIAALDLAGVAVVFSAGNNGPSSNSVGFPGGFNISAVVPFAVGAVNGGISGFPVASFSSRGPTPCGGSGNLLIKPEVVAPGVDVRSAGLNGGYEVLDGTSMAAPHVSGAILLLKEAFPTAPGNLLATALYESADDLGDPGEDNIFGRGMINLPKAYNYLLERGLTPATPISPRYDVVQVNLKSRALNCGGQLFLEVTIENAGQDTLRTLDVLLRREGATVTLAQQNWRGRLAPGRIGTYLLDPIALPVGTYTVEVELRNPNGQPDQRPLNNQIKERITVTNTALLPVATSLAPAACRGSRAVLQANYQGTGKIQWFNQVTGGTPFATGNTVTTGALDRDTTFWAEVLFSQKAGLERRDAGSFVVSDSLGGLYFNCLAPFTLKSVVIYPARTGIITIVLRAPNGGIQQRLFNITRTGEQRVTLNFNVAIGNGYTLEMTRGRQLSITTSNLSLPLTVPGVLSILRSTNYAPQSVYAYFYDWDIDYAYPCGRVAVRVPVNRTVTAPRAGFSSPRGPLTLASNGTVTAAFRDSSANAVIWNWDFGNGASSAMTNPQVAFSAPGIYPVTLVVTNALGCTDVAFRNVEVKLATAIAEPNAADPLWLVYPNPASNLLQVQLDLPAAAEVELQLLNLLGQTLVHQHFGLTSRVETTVPVGNLPPGTYVLNGFVNGQPWVQKIQVVH